MKTRNKILSVLLCLVLCAAFAGCVQPTVSQGPDLNEEVDTSRTQLYVFNYGGGFGSDWLRAAKTRFEALHVNDVYEEGKKGVQIVIDHKKQPFTGTEIKASHNDVFFTEAVNYYSLYNDGAMLDLTDALTKPLSDLDADDSESVLDKFFPEQAAYYGIGEGESVRYYAVPHYAAYYGLIYNVDLFDSEGYYFADNQDNYLESGMLEDKFVTKMNSKKAAGPDGEYGTSDDGLPVTYEQFFELCRYIVKTGGIPLNWTGANYRDYLNTLMYALVVDYEGKDSIMKNYTFTGSADNLGHVDAQGQFVYDAQPTPIGADTGNELYRSDSRYYALQFLQQLCMDDVEHNAFHNDWTFNGDYSHMAAQTDFLYAGIDGKTPKMAMLVDGVWWQMEAVSTFTDMIAFYGDEYSQANRRFAFMPLPKANEAKAAEAAKSNVKNTLYDAQYSSAFIRSTIEDYKKDLALEFLRFVNTQESLVEYTQITNTTKALDYELTEAEKAQLTHYGRSLIELQERSEIVYPYAKNSLYLNNAASFKPSQMFFSNVGNTEYQFPAEAFREEGVTAAQYFTGMESYYDAKWPTLQR